MGNYIFTVTKCSSNNIPTSFNPSNYDWLTIHSMETGLSIVEVQRLWKRFQQLGCDSSGLWNLQIASNSTNKIAKDQFQLKIINHLHAPGQQTVTFYDFINAALWLEKSTVDDKLKISFAIINGNLPITIDSLTKFLVLLFPSKRKEDIDQYVSEIFEKIGIINSQTKTQEINEEDFVYFIKSSVSRENLESILQMKIFPNLKPLSSRTEIPNLNKSFDNFPNNSHIPTDVQLDEIARLVGEKDYGKLASLLGILQYDLKQFEHIYRGQKHKIIFHFLREWKQKEGARASFNVLKRALTLAGFEEIFNRIEFG